MLTHTKIAGTESYELKLDGKVMFQVNKRHSLFVLADDPRVYAPTMRDLKEAAWNLLPEEERNPPAKAPRLTLKAVAAACAWSHSEIYINTKEAARIWPELKGEALYAYYLRKHHTALASWGHAAGKKWLEENPELGKFDPAEELRRIEASYGPQPDWVH